MNNLPISEEKSIAKISYKELFVKLWPFARNYRLQFFMVIICIVGLAVCSRLIPTLIGYAINEGIKKSNSDVFLMIAWSYLGVEILKTIFNFSAAYLFSRFGNRVLFDLRSALLDHTQRLPLQFFNKTPTGRIVTRITNDVAALGELFTEGIITIFIQIVIMSAIVISMLLISVKLTIITLAAAPLFIWAAFKLSNHIRNILREQKAKLSALNAFLAENLNGIKVVQLYNRISRNQEKFQKQSLAYREINMKSIFAYAHMQPIMNLFTAITLTAALYYGGLLSLENGIAIGSLVAFLMHAQDFIPPLREIMEKYQQFQNSLTSAERVFSLLEEPIESALDNPDKSALISKGALDIRNLNFKYEEHLPWTLKNINLSISPGESIALVGRTGSGKSTFISLLQRMYNAPDETIFIDGHPIEKFPRAELRRWIGVVQQDNYIFRGTIADNVSLGEQSITRKQVEEAVAMTGYADLLARTGRSIDSTVEEKGANLSVGERQLIAFARILAFNPQILILDEATANIDSESEKMIQEATSLVTEGRTSIIIAHRLSTIQKCDRIYVLSDGEIIESGSHQELQNSKGYYHQLHQKGGQVLFSN